MKRPRDVTRRAAVGLTIGVAAAATQAHAIGIAPKQAPAMERVTGIGGFFFRAKDPKALAQWYDDNLGILPVPTGAGMPSWRTEAGETAFAPFPEDTSYFGDPGKQWMINFRVADLDKMAAQLRAKGVTVDIDPQIYPAIGRFAALHDPEGNPIQLWQPADEKAR